MKPRHLLIGLCTALLLAPGALAGTDADSGHVCSGDRDFDCQHMECTDLLCVWYYCQVYIGHSGHASGVPACVPT